MATCAYVDHVQDEIKVDLLRAAREMLQHERGWREIPVVRPDRHRRIGNDHRKTARRRIQGVSFSEHF